MNNHRPRVSIGLPVYNGDRFLVEALEAILAQTCKDFELIISDNSSTDTTGKICQAYAASDQRIRYYRNERNIGGHKNFNRVFELATGKYFKWAAHDDLCAPDYLERCIEVLEQNPSVVLCYSKTKLIDEHGSVLNINCDENPLLTHSLKPELRFRNLIVESFAQPYRGFQLFGLIRTSTLAKIPLLGDYSGADLVLLARLALLGQFYQIPEYLFFNRDHSQRSIKALNNPYLRTAWFDPTKEGKLVFHKWSHFFGYLNSINQTALNFHEKIYCYTHLVTWLSSNWDVLLKEVLKAAIWPIYFSRCRSMLLAKN